MRIFLRRRYYANAAIFLLLSLSFVLIAVIDKDLYSSEEVPFFHVNIQMPDGTKLEETEKVVSEITKLVQTLPDEEVNAIVSQAGMMITDTEWLFNADVGQITVDLVLKEYRERSEATQHHHSDNLTCRENGILVG